jgi:hypothetical protein
MAAPASWDTYAFQVRSFCRQEFAGNETQINLCLAAFAGSPTAEEAKKKLLCVGVDGTTDEIFECQTGASTVAYEQLTDPRVGLARRFGPTVVEDAKEKVRRAEGFLAAFVPNPALAGAVPPRRERRIEAAPPRPAGPVAPAPPAPTAPTPVAAVTLDSSVLHCVPQANLPVTALAAVISTVDNLDQVHVGGEAEKIDEMCHQVQDALPKEPGLQAFYACLCPQGSRHRSLLQVLQG